MKGATVALILIGTIALTVGGVCMGIGIYNKAQNEYVIENKYDITDAFTNIDVDIDTADLYFKVSDDDKIKVECNDRERIYHEAKVVDNTLRVTKVDHRRWYERYIFPWNLKRFDVTVYLPTATYGDLTIKTATGNVDFEKGPVFGNATIKSSTGNVLFNNDVTETADVTTSTGNIKIKDFSAKNVKAKSSTGNINVEDLHVEEEINTNSSTGNNTLTRITADTVVVKTTTGGIKLTDVVASTSFDLKASTGSIKFEKCDAGTIKARTSTGSIKGTLLSTKIFDATSGTGSVHVPVSGSGGLCELRSDTGSINITLVD